MFVSDVSIGTLPLLICIQATLIKWKKSQKKHIDAGWGLRKKSLCGRGKQIRKDSEETLIKDHYKRERKNIAIIISKKHYMYV